MTLSIDVGRLPSWLLFPGASGTSAQRPLFPLKQTFANVIGMSVKCH